MALRYEAGVERGFESEEFYGHWDVGVSVGISVFTK